VVAAAELAAAAAELGVPLDIGKSEALVRYAELLLRWNRVHNLTALDADRMLTHHLLDSLAVVPLLDTRARGEQTLRILDVGAGGGLPGMVLAIARPQWQVMLVDKVAKKVAFLRQVQLELGLDNVNAVHARVESLRAGPFDIIIARAFAALGEFVRLTRPLLAPGGGWYAMKGALPRAEIDALERDVPGVRVAQVAKLHVPRLDAERHLVLIEPS
jgi:16S rRNA (guanine527-N7)-methyltransferase